MDLTLEIRKKKHKLSLYSTCKHKSLQGLDFVSAAGAKDWHSKVLLYQWRMMIPCYRWDGLLSQQEYKERISR